jgi:hypothetical protein
LNTRVSVACLNLRHHESGIAHLPQDQGSCMACQSAVMLQRSGVAKLGLYVLFLWVTLILIHGVTSQSIIRASVLKVKII